MTLTSSYWPADTSDLVQDTTVGDVLRSAAAEHPDFIALVAGMPDPADRRRWTYRELLADAEQTACALLGRFEPGERVAAWAPNIPEWIVLEYAAALAGLILVTVNPAYRPSELSYVLNQSGAAGIFLVPEFRSPMAAYLEEIRPQVPDLREVVLFTEWDAFKATGSPTEKLPDVPCDEPVQIQYTSGTTGAPKGALLHHRGITNNARYFADRLKWVPGDVFVSPMPLFHTAGCVLGVLGCAQARATLVPLVAFDPGLALDLIETERSTGLLGVPTMLIAIAEHPTYKDRDLSSVRSVTSGGTPVPADLARKLEADLGVAFTIVFGTTECSPLLTQTRPDDTADDRAETLGQPLPQTEVMIADSSTGKPVPIGAVGELCARGYLVMKGYWNMPEETASSIDAEGWYHTGDLASMDERGYLRIEGRLKDMIIRGGENIYPREIEDVLYSHPAVAEVSVVGVPDARWGEVVAAFIRPSAEAPTQQELFLFCRERLAAYKTPNHWVFVDAFPLTPSGKIQKFVLRERFVAERAADVGP